MKKKLLVFCFINCLFFPIFCHEIQLYTSDSLTLGKVSKYSKGTIGHGLSFSYNIPYYNIFSATLKLEHSLNILKSNENIFSWNNLVTSLGLTASFKITESFIIRPQFDFGLCLNFISASDSLQKTYPDTVLQISNSFIISNIALTPFYRLMAEQETICHYIGLNLGIIIKLNKES